MKALLGAVAFTIAGSLAWAQVPGGPIFQVNSYTTLQQYRQSAATHPSRSSGTAAGRTATRSASTGSASTGEAGA